MHQTMKRRRTARHRVFAMVASLGVAAVIGATMAPAASAAPSLTVGSPKLDLGFEGDDGDASAFAHPTQLRGHQGSAPNGAYPDGVSAGTQALWFGGNTFLDLC